MGFIGYLVSMPRWVDGTFEHDGLKNTSIYFQNFSERIFFRKKKFRSEIFKKPPTWPTLPSPIIVSTLRISALLHCTSSTCNVERLKPKKGDSFGYEVGFTISLTLVKHNFSNPIKSLT